MGVSLKGGAGKGKKAGKGKSNKGGKARGKGGKGGKGKGKKKEKMECGESGTYGDLQKKTGNNEFDRDHIPSKAALKAKATDLKGSELCPEQKTAVDKIGNAIAIPKGVHSEFSETYGGRNTDAVIQEDALGKGGLQAAAKRDTKAVTKGMKNPCKKKYQAWAKKINKITNAQYTRMLQKAIKVGK